MLEPTRRGPKAAFRALKEKGAPVICNGSPSLQWHAEFILSAEHRTGDGLLWADYYGEEVREHYREGTNIVENAFRIRTEVHEILNQYGLYAEWIDPGTVGIYFQ